MSAPKSRQDLLELIRQSGLLNKKQFKHFTQSCPSKDLPVLLTWLVKAGFITEYQGRELYAGRHKGFFIGKYKVLRPLASGGMGMVLHCEHIHMKHQVALKLLPQDMSKDQQAISRFYREARAVAAVHHPNIVKAYDVGQEGPWHCLVMEFVDGINLHKLVQRIGPLSEVMTAHYMSQTASGMQEIQKSGLVHRDLKPSNLLIDREGTIKILDLGLARFTDQRADDLTRLLEYEHVLGTADFISPEQALRASEVDIRADIYGLGMTMYFLLTGHLPFEGGTLATKLMAHQSKMPAPLRDVRPEISRELDAVMLKMIQKNPNDRYQHPREIIEALKPWTAQRLATPAADWFVSSSATPIRIQPAQAKTKPDSAPASQNAMQDTQFDSVGSAKLDDPSTASLTPTMSGQGTAVQHGTIVQDVQLKTLKESSTLKLHPVTVANEDGELPTITAIQERLANVDKRRAGWRDRQRRQLLIALAVAVPVVGILGMILWYVITRPRPDIGSPR